MRKRVFAALIVVALAGSGASLAGAAPSSGKKHSLNETIRQGPL